MAAERLTSSFRDPSGFLFRRDGVLLRQVNEGYQDDYERLIRSGLYDELVAGGRLVSHEEVNAVPLSDDAYRILQPDPIPYISYPYEWSFSQLKDAALLTLEIQKISLKHEMSLKDASAFNVQFVGSRPIFIDSLSFEAYNEGAAWVAYRQFCQHFLGPLALMAHSDIRLQHLLRSYIDGIPLDVVSQLLPTATRFRYSLLSHIHLHASSQLKHQDAGSDGRTVRVPRMSKRMLEALIGSLESAVRRLQLPGALKTEWGDYYENTNYTDESMAAKEAAVVGLLEKHGTGIKVIHDLGANTGRFSRLAVGVSDYVVGHDVDPLAVERHYLAARETDVDDVLPLLLDLTNPTPNLGWNLSERMSFSERASGGLIMALAVIHHLAISNNVPLGDVSRFFSGVSEKLLIEFVPKSDTQVQRLLATREDVFPDYTVEAFEKAFAADFELLEKVPIPGTERFLYFMQRSPS